MKNFQSTVANVVALFPPNAAARPAAERDLGLSSRDKMDVAKWRDIARMAGFDRLVVHDREYGDSASFENFLSVYRAGEVWSCFGFVRQGNIVRAWSSLTGAELGEFPDLATAFACVLLNDSIAPLSADNVVKLRAERQDIARTKMGSAA